MRSSKPTGAVYVFCLFAASALLPISAHSVYGQQMILTGDTQITSLAPSSNYGAAQTLAINPSSSALLQFDLRDILPTGTTPDQVVRARLILFPNAVTVSGRFDVFPATSSWNEGSTTYATQPALKQTSDGSGLAKERYHSAFVVVTELIQGWIRNPARNYGLEVKATGTTDFSIDSKENTATSHPAVLQIDLAGPTGAIGPQGPVGATGAQGIPGATGPAGPQGPSGTLTLPYSGTGTTPEVQDQLGAPVFMVTNQGTSGVGIEGVGGPGPVAFEDPSLAPPGTGVIGRGGDVETGPDGTGVAGYGGSGETGPGGIGVAGYGGDEGLGSGGLGIVGIGGASGTDDNGKALPRVAAMFVGDVQIQGNLSKSGGSFKIDDPVDPANKYLYHSFVESPDMKNIYDGTVITDSAGDAKVSMPAYFEALNREFRYQLTVIGQFAQAIVASEIANDAFTIKTDKPNVKVSWQVTGTRQDAWANAHRIPVEEDKSKAERGRYLNPELFDQPAEMRILPGGVKIPGTTKK